MCNTDVSYTLYKKYFLLATNEVEIMLKNNTILKGKIVGYFKNENENDIPFIIKWHIAETTSFLAIDVFGFLQGSIIKHSDISSVFFYEDGSTIKL